MCIFWCILNCIKPLKIYPKLPTIYTQLQWTCSGPGPDKINMSKVPDTYYNHLQGFGPKIDQISKWWQFFQTVNKK